MPKRRRIPQDARAAIGLAVFLTLLGELVGDASFAVVLIPLVTVLAMYAMWRVPIYESAIALLFLALVLADPADTDPLEDFAMPLFGTGSVLLAHLNAVGRSHGVSAEWAKFSLMDIFLVWLFLIGFYRARMNKRIDTVDRAPTPRPLLQLAWLSLGGTAFTWFWGLASGGDFGMSLWQLNRVLYLPLVFFICHYGLRGPKDIRVLGKVILVAGTYKALMALYVVWIADMPPDEWGNPQRPDVAVSHQDSILFATAFVVVFTQALERVGNMRKSLRLALLLLPVLGAGMWANNRRMVWVQVGIVFLTIYFLTSKENRVKRNIQRAIYVVSPFAALYVLLGWNRGTGIFGPVGTLRSVVDAESDPSSLWRELENFDLMQTLKANPILGTGYGHKFYEVLTLPQVPYSLEFYAPHNSILGIWAFAGVVGYTTLTLLWMAGTYYAVRTYHAARNPEFRAAAQTIIGIQLIYMVQCWGDLGIGAWVGVYLMGVAMALAGKLAVASGQWDPRNAA